jgi:NADPH-dependent glutamate synthase beta subunit-like oxidoreductase
MARPKPREEEAPRRTPMYEQVGPDSAQSVMIAALVEEHRARMNALNEEFQENYDPRYRAIIEETREAIKEVFTAEQAAEYQRLVEERIAAGPLNRPGAATTPESGERPLAGRTGRVR